MSVRRKTSPKTLSGFTSLVVLFALVVPFAGAAVANHISGISISPTTDTAPAGTCNAFTVTLTGATSQTDTNPGAEGETIDIIVTDTDEDDNANTVGGANESDIVFCRPAGTQVEAGMGSDEFGPNPQVAVDTTPSGPSSFNTLDDNTTNRRQGEVRPTDVNGQVTFGILSSEAGTFSVLAFYDDPEDDDNPANDFTATATKTFTAGAAQGNEGVTDLDCSPEMDINPEGTQHSFNCIATDVNGNAVSGATIQFDVTAGPNAEEVGPMNCFASTTDSQGQTSPGATNPDGTPTATSTGTNGQATCAYTDTETNNDNNSATNDTSPPGVDTIVAFVGQTPGTGETGTPGADSFEPQDEITKSFVGDANTIECADGDSGTAQAGDIVDIECRVTDVSGQPVPNVDVDFEEDGAGTFRGTTECTTGVDGTCSVQIETVESEAGQNVIVTATIRGDSANGADSNGFTGDTNCTSTGGANPGTNADCTDTVTVALQEGSVATDCNDGVDNDGDGDIDFPADDGCTSAEDSAETGDPVADPTVVRRSRTLEITALRHVDLPGKKRPALLVKGRVSSTNFDECAAEVPIKIQIRAGGEFITRKSDTTNGNGVFKVLIRDVQAKYRAVATKFQIEDTEANEINVCLKARDVRRHRH